MLESNEKVSLYSLNSDMFEYFYKHLYLLNLKYSQSKRSLFSP